MVGRRPPADSTAEITATQWEQMHEKAFGNRTQIPSEWFLHCYFEAAANLFAGTLELLLQSRGGVIYVFPALAEARTAMFTLWAEDGFLVTSECANGDIRYIAVESTRGGCAACACRGLRRSASGRDIRRLHLHWMGRSSRLRLLRIRAI